jgi:YesN/AraC family two-component response regulator
VISAENGKIGLQRAVDELPDFIITDVMMPVMDGLSMIHQIKQNKDICHIPVIVLSAKASLEDRLQGLQEGIDDYITKPFSATYLKRRIENIISQRHALQQSYLEQITPENSAEYKLESPQIVDADQQMMKTLMNFLEDNIGNPELRIDDLASAVNLGRTVFYEKIKSIVGMTPVDFVRHVRMQRAEELVARSKSSFSEIAYAVGFSDPKYFSKCFKKETGMSPSEYREKVKK